MGQRIIVHTLTLLLLFVTKKNSFFYCILTACTIPTVIAGKGVDFNLFDQFLRKYFWKV